MKVAAPALLPLLRSQAQGEILAWVFLMPGEHSIAEIARETSISEATVLREVNRLVATGFITERRQGRARLVSPTQQNAATQPLTALLAVTFGPPYVLSERLTRLSGIDFAAIHGSWAARATGYPGHAPNDIDLLVVGEVSSADLDEIAADASSSLRRPVLVTTLSLATWQAAEDPFVVSVQERPLITLIDHLSGS